MNDKWIWRAVAGVLYALVFVVVLTAIEEWLGAPEFSDG